MAFILVTMEEIEWIPICYFVIGLISWHTFPFVQITCANFLKVNQLIFYLKFQQKMWLI